ncbi:peptidase [Phaeobacter sp. QD34_3]|uniref:peptidase n=1 Tax=unclassified Phaeobacter TaxID=2621772 RepID=UPI00237EFF5E|nr:MULTISPECIES: peptidase [unclassified Phaeobacter]MDE4132112.1 peptidase [Phaeobacter sp. QD34_3]MDE4135750.1 peptidase [Phaeobacter sp. QD34_24]
MSGAGIAALARGWLGTPYVHQASRREAGCDCLGLIRGIWREALGAEPAPLPPYTMDWSEPQGQERLWQAAHSYLTPKPLEGAALGDVLLFRMRTGSVAKHLGIQSELGDTGKRAVSVPRFIHAYSGRGVVECALSAPWQRRIVARFAYPQEVL